MNFSVWPDEGAYSAARKIANIVQIFENSEDVLPYISAFAPMCLFVAVRYLIVARALRFTAISHNEIVGLKRALGQAAKIFPVAGIIFLMQN